MKKIALFRSPSEEYESVFRANNYEVVFIEPLQFVFVNQKELKTKLKQTDYDGLILTSPRAIEAVADNWNVSEFTLWNSKKVYTVGEASGYKIKHLLGLEACGTSSGNAEKLANTIVSENSAISKFLYPCGNLRSEILPKILQSVGITLDCVTVYETQVNGSLETDLIELNNDKESVCCLVFFSPSGCEYVHRTLQTIHNNITVLPHIAIGNVTAQKFEMMGLEIAGVAEKPTAESLVAAVKAHVEATQSVK